MDDHVHPTLQGQDLIARSIAGRLTTVDGPMHVDAARFAALPDWQTYARRLGDTEYDHYAVAHTIRVLNNIPFFKETNPEALARYNKIVSDLEAGFPPEILETCRNWQKPETHIGGQRPISGMVGRVMIKRGRFAEAEKLCAAAIRHVAPYTSWNLEFTYFMLVSRERVHGKLSDADRRIALDAIERGKFLLSHGTVTTGLTERFMGRLHQLRGEWAEAIPFLVHARQKLAGNDLVAADQALIESYVRTGDRTSATKIIEQGEAQPAFADQYRRMRQAFLKQ